MNETLFVFKCPHCQGDIEAKQEWRGQVVQCPYCEKGIVVPKARRSENPTTVRKKSTNVNRDTSIGHGQCVGVKDDGKNDLLGKFFSRLIKFWKWRFFEPVFLKCPKCGKQQILYARSPSQSAYHVCSCSVRLRVIEYVQAYADFRNALDARKKELNGRIIVTKEKKRFDADWDVFKNTSMPKKILRLKEDTDRFYKKLQIVTSKRTILAVNKAEASNVVVGNTLDDWAGVLVSIAGAVEYHAISRSDEKHNYTQSELEALISQNEHVIDYYRDLCDEFDGIERLTAYRNRMKRIFGVSIEELRTPLNDDELDNAKNELSTIDSRRQELVQLHMNNRNAASTAIVPVIGIASCMVPIFILIFALIVKVVGR